MQPEDWENMNHEKFNLLFKDSAVERTGFNELTRNINLLKISTSK